MKKLKIFEILKIQQIIFFNVIIFFWFVCWVYSFKSSSYTLENVASHAQPALQIKIFSFLKEISFFPFLFSYTFGNTLLAFNFFFNKRDKFKGNSESPKLNFYILVGRNRNLNILFKFSSYNMQNIKLRYDDNWQQIIYGVEREEGGGQ